jgi:hypothetical protein
MPDTATTYLSPWAPRGGSALRCGEYTGRGRPAARPHARLPSGRVTRSKRGRAPPQAVATCRHPDGGPHAHGSESARVAVARDGWPRSGHGQGEVVVLHPGGARWTPAQKRRWHRPRRTGATRPTAPGVGSRIKIRRPNPVDPCRAWALAWPQVRHAVRVGRAFEPRPSRRLGGDGGVGVLAAPADPLGGRSGTRRAWVRRPSVCVTCAAFVPSLGWWPRGTVSLERRW